MKLSNLSLNPKNPRKITDAKLTQLRKAITKFGDLSGVVFNRKTKQLVCGHQRIKSIDDTDITVTKKYSKPSKTGTVAEGYFSYKGEKFAYREVWWDENLEKAANIAANKGAGEWDLAQLNEWLEDLNKFDLNFDLSLTMFDAQELEDLPHPIKVAGHTRTPGNGEDKEEKDPGPAKCKPGQVYALGTHRIKIGDDHHHFFDKVIKQWEKLTEEEAVLQTKTQLKKAASHPQKHA